MKNIVYFDLETQLLQEEVGGWENAKDMKLSIAVVYDSGAKLHIHYDESKVAHLLDLLWDASLIVGFNIEGFDYKVLSRYTSSDLSVLPTWDMLTMIKPYIKHRLSLNNLARTTLGERKSGDGANAVHLYRQERFQELMDYCEADVDITRNLFRCACQSKELQYTDKYGEIHAINTSDWMPRVKAILDNPVEKPNYELNDLSHEDIDSTTHKGLTYTILR